MKKFSRTLCKEFVLTYDVVEGTLKSDFRKLSLKKKCGSPIKGLVE